LYCTRSSNKPQKTDLRMVSTAKRTERDFPVPGALRLDLYFDDLRSFTRKYTGYCLVASRSSLAGTGQPHRAHLLDTPNQREQQRLICHVHFLFLQLFPWFSISNDREVVIAAFGDS